MYRGKRSACLAAALFLTGALAVSACGKKETLEETLAEDPQETQTASEEPQPEENDSPVSMEGLPESIMDVICAANGIAAMEDGSLLVTDLYSKVIWRVQPRSGVSEVYAGGETVTDLYGEPVGGYNDADLEDSFFQSPWAIAPFLDGWAVSDAENNAVRLIREEVVQTVNGSTKEQLTIQDMGVVFAYPTGLAADDKGNLYVSDTHNGAVRVITPMGEVSTVADQLELPMGLCWKDGALYVTETGANRILKIADGETKILAGCGENDLIDGAAQDAAFAYPEGLAVADDGAVYVADTGNSAVRVIRDGQVSTLLSRDRSSLEMNPVSPMGLLIQGDQLYICDNFARKVLRVALDASAQ